MDYILWVVIGVIAAIIFFAVADFLIKRHGKPKSAESAIWNAVYFIQLRQYDRALGLLEYAEQEFAMTPEVMCDLCVQRGDAYAKLKEYDKAADSYDVLYEALHESGRKIKRMRFIGFSYFHTRDWVEEAAYRQVEHLP
ncbi:MAG: hypothetical protein IJC46_05515, partial [Clostridia bacterium]|nr:hypothetical protein [Clostridia bacterium]